MRISNETRRDSDLAVVSWPPCKYSRPRLREEGNATSKINSFVPAAVPFPVFSLLLPSTVPRGAIKSRSAIPRELKGVNLKARK